MESEKFNKQISDALRRMQPQQPADMTERFMERLRREGLPAQPKPAPRRTARCISLSAVAAAAAVLLLVFLPLKQKPTQPAAPQLAQSDAPQAAASTPTAATAQPVVSAHSASAAHATPSVAPVPAAATVSQPQTQPEELIAVAQPATAPQPEEQEETPTAPSVATASQSQPTFTAEERRLMERAEEMRPQALLYAAELLQSARIEARERQQALFAKQETSDHKQIITSI